MRSPIETPSEWEVNRAFENAVAAAAGVRNAADAALVDLVVKALDEGWWEGWKIHTPVQWLMWQTGASRHTARRIVALARRAADLPSVMATFRRGGLSLDQAATVARYTPAEYEASVCEFAVNATVNQIVAATRQYGFDAEIADRDSRERSGPERSVSFGTDEGDQWRASIRLPADEGQVVEEALKASRERLHHAQRAAAKERAEAQGRPTTGTDAEVGVVGVAHSVLNRRVRRLVEHRDGGCRVPGCDSHLWIEVHHITHWEDHGETVTWNLLCLCAHHHRMHHQGLLGIAGNADTPDGVTFTTASGMVLRPSGRPTEPSALPPVEPYDGPTGERLQKHWVTFSRRPPPCERRREPAA